MISASGQGAQGTAALIGKKHYPGDRIVINGHPYIVIGVRKYQGVAQRLRAKENAKITIIGSNFYVVKPADTYSPQQPTVAQGQP